MILVPYGEQEIIVNWNLKEGVILEVPVCKVRVTGRTSEEAIRNLKRELKIKIDSGELVYSKHIVDLKFEGIPRKG